MDFTELIWFLFFLNIVAFGIVFILYPSIVRASMKLKCSEYPGCQLHRRFVVVLSLISWLLLTILMVIDAYFAGGFQ